MARLTWTAGDKATPWREVDSDAFTLSSAWARVLRLIGLVNDIAHGENTPPITLDASGSGTGCPLGIPLGQEIRPRVSYTGTTTAEAYLAIVPVYLPDGENAIRVELDYCPTDAGARFQVLDPTDLSTIVEIYANHLNNPTQAAYALFTGLPDGTDYVLAVRANVRTQTSNWGQGAFRAFFLRLGGDTAPSPDLGIGSDISLNTQAGASSAVIADIVDLDTTWLNSGGASSALPIDARSLDAAARNLATLDEEILGRPAMGVNAATTLASSTGDTDPADDAFLSGSRSVYSAEPVFDFPVALAACGIAPVDGGTGLSLGIMTTDCWCPGGQTNTDTPLSIVRCRMPDLNPTSGGVELRVRMLFFSPDGSVIGAGTDCNSKSIVYDETLSAITSATQVDSSWTNPSGNWHISEVVLTDWGADVDGLITAGYDASAGGHQLAKSTGESLRLAGWSCYFVKT